MYYGSNPKEKDKMSTGLPGNGMQSGKDVEAVGDARALWQGGFSGKSMIGSWAFAVSITILVLIVMMLIEPLREAVNAWLVGGGLIATVWLYLIGVMFYRKWGMHYELTSQQLKHREGIFFRQLDRIELIDIDDVNYRQGPVQAVLGVGNIKIRSSDTSHPELTMYGIANIREVADLIDDARRTERRKRGLHIETI